MIVAGLRLLRLPGDQHGDDGRAAGVGEDARPRAGAAGRGAARATAARSRARPAAAARSRTAAARRWRTPSARAATPAAAVSRRTPSTSSVASNCWPSERADARRARSLAMPSATNCDDEQRERSRHATRRSSGTSPPRRDGAAGTATPRARRRRRRAARRRAPTDRGSFSARSSVCRTSGRRSRTDLDALPGCQLALASHVRIALERHPACVRRRAIATSRDCPAAAGWLRARRRGSAAASDPART